jgi:hypothetical protein
MATPEQMQAAIQAMLGDDGGANPYLVQALRGQEALGVAGHLGGPLLREQANAITAATRNRLGDVNEARQMVLKRALWQQERAASAPPTEGMLSAAEAIGIPRDRAALFTGPQLQGILSAQTQRGLADQAKQRAMESPEAKAERARKEQADRLEGELKRATLEERRRAAAGAPAKTTADLRSEFQSLPVVKDTEVMASAYGKVTSADPTAAGDMSSIFAYMKILDPGSTVREGEFASAQNAAGIPDRIRNMYNRAASGEILAPEQREDFKAQARNLLKAQKSRYDAKAAEYRRLAREAGVPESNVVLDMGLEGLVEAPKGAPSSKAVTGGSAPRRPRRTVNGETREWDGAKWVPIKE